MEKVDVKGLSCPMPVLKTKQAIDGGAKELLIVGTSQVSKENVSKLAKSQGFNVNITVDQKDSWEMEIKK
ncbi:MAG: sulfurtransferase TusA family protein [Syntrophomonadaceae bacterium]|nr:sulfurtransferase TusA family protein [Syntrophomonadaceae bacterium]MDD3889402.1 sulfurtransferase TusA family protein [Syntrophomonadaceae bacterium]MDD4549524.1 sulfurtransferase TusA family protein [Syntrophomonadaceae bacterium]